MTTEHHAQGARSGRARLHVYPVQDGGWTWRYVEADTGVELLSNTIFSTADMAADSARRAYPDVEPADHEPSGEARGAEGAGSS